MGYGTKPIAPPPTPPKAPKADSTYTSKSTTITSKSTLGPLPPPSPSADLVQAIKPEETVYVAVTHENRVPTARELTFAVQATLESRGYSMDRIDLDLRNVAATYFEEPKGFELGYSSVWQVRIPQFKLK